MRHSPVTLLAAVVLIACAADSPPREAVRVQTLDEAGLRAANRPSTLQFRTTEIIRPDPGQRSPQSLAAADSAVAVSDLPFAPAIAMDPVDGGKVSITANTPIAEHKDRIYYFNSAANKRTFLQDPETYLTGKLATY